MTSIKIVILLALVYGLRSAEVGGIEVPKEAVPFEVVNEINDKGVKLVMKTSGHKMEVGGKTIAVGPWKVLAGDILSQEGFYDKEGKKTGAWTQYYPNGKPYLLMSYKADALNGFFTAFSPEGKPMAIKWFVDGKEVGMGVTLSTEGKVVSVEKYNNGIISEVIKAE
jgi:hypothetical protein